MIGKQITGCSLSERHKSLNHLILTFDDRDFKPDLTTLSKNDKIDNLFIAGVATKFRQSSVIFELLKSEDGLIVSKALKSNWFFDGTTCKDVTNIDNFFTNLFPHISHTTRCKIISQLSVHLKDCNAADQFYMKIKESFGLNQAVKLLPVCSEQLIRDELKAGVEIPSNKMKFIFKKYPLLIIKYVEESLESENTKFLFQNIESLLESIVKCYTSTFVKIYDKYKNCSQKWSYRASVLILKNIPFEQLQIRNLNSRAISKTLDDDSFKKMILEQLPNEIGYYFPNDTHELIKLRYGNNADSFFVSVFQSKYKKSILEADMNWFSFIEKLPLEQRAEWAKNMIAIKKSNEEEKYTMYLDCDTAIKRYMILIQIKEDSYGRKEIVKNMIDTCKINNNMTNLLEVLKLAVKRFRNDDIVTLGFLTHFYKCFDIYQLPSEHQELINQMVSILMVDIKIKSDYSLREVLRIVLNKKIIYHLKNNIEIGSILDQMDEYKLGSCKFEKTEQDLRYKYVEIQLKRFKSSLEKADSLEGKQNQKINHLTEKCFDLIKDYNDCYPDRKIDIIDYDWLIERANSYFAADSRGFTSYINMLFNMSDKTKKMFLKLILKNSCEFKALNYALKYDPSAINVEKLAKDPIYKCFTESKWIFSKVKVYLNNTLCAKVKDFINKNIVLENSNQGYLIINLLMLSNEDQYEVIIEKYFSSKTKRDPSDEESEKNYVLMEPIVRKLLYLNPPPSYDMIESFAKDDYLKLVLSSLLSISYRKSYKDTCEFIERLSNKAVSVKKHSIRLADAHFKIENLLAFYKRASTEKHNSIRSVVFNRTFKLLELTTNPQIIKGAWDTIKYYMESFDEKDASLFSYLSKVSAFPDDVKLDFCKTSWSTLKRLKESNLQLNTYDTCFVESVINHMDKLGNDFCVILVDDYIESMSEKSNIAKPLLDFCLRYIMSSNYETFKEVPILQLNKIIDSYKDYIIKNWNDSENSSRSCVENFVDECCFKIIKNQCHIDPSIVINQLLSLLDSTLPSECVFDLVILLKLTTLYVEAKNNICLKNVTFVRDPNLQEVMDKFSVKILHLINESIEKYGSEITYLLYEAVQSFVSKISIWLSDDLMKLCLIDKMLTYDSKSRHILLFIVYLLPKYEKKNNVETITDHEIYEKEKHQYIIETIKNNGDLTVKLVLNSRIEISSVELFGQI